MASDNMQFHFNFQQQHDNEGTGKAPRHEGVWGSGCRDPRFLDLDIRWWSLVVSFTPLPLYSRYLPDRRLGGPHSDTGDMEK
jgi:hypothetical protein